MAIGKFHGAMMPTTPTGSRVTSMSTPGRTLANFSPGMRSDFAGEEVEDLRRRASTSPIASGSVLPSSRGSRRPSSSLRAAISSETFNRTSWRSCGVVRAQPCSAARAALTASST